MSRSPVLRPADVRALLRLSHEVHSTVDPADRKARMVAGLCRLLEACAGALALARVDNDGRRVTISLTENGKTTGRLREVLAQGRPPEQLHHASKRDCADGEWLPASRYGKRQLYHSLWCPAAGGDAWFVGCLAFTRERSAFSPHHRLILHVAHLEMNWVYHGDLLLASRSAEALTPRQRQTLQYLLAGHSEKQIAAQLGLSTNTVHHYVKAIHRHFRVSSRSELLALWLH